jgi:hypothetical protein
MSHYFCLYVEPYNTGHDWILNIQHNSPVLSQHTTLDMVVCRTMQHNCVQCISADPVLFGEIRYEEIEERLVRPLTTPEEMDQLDKFVAELDAGEAGLLAARTNAVAASWQLLADSRFTPQVKLVPCRLDRRARWTPLNNRNLSTN